MRIDMMSVMRCPGLFFAIAVILVSAMHASNREDANTGDFPVTFSGTVDAGQHFEHRINDDYLFVLRPQLRPENPQGWTIQVVDPEDRSRDYVWVVTPPYRFQNPRYLDTGYGLTPRRAVAWTPRKFNVLRRTKDLPAVVDALRAALWPEPGSARRGDAASVVEKAIADAREGELRIERFAVSSDRIERLSFTVSIR